MIERTTRYINGGEKVSRKCPSCHSKNVWKDGKRKTKNGSIQRYVCKDCWRRFSESSVLSIDLNNNSKRQVCEFLIEGSKNLAKEEPHKSRLAGATKKIVDIKGKILQFEWELKKQGLEKSIKTYGDYLRTLQKSGADILDPESVKEVIANKEWSTNTKALAIAAYSKFLKIMGGLWDPPKCKRIRKLSFVPEESELDALISGACPKLATFLLLLKETGLRSGEAWNIKWRDIDFKKGIVVVNEPQKQGKPRILKISSTLIAMLREKQSENERLFIGSLQSFRDTFRRYRIRMSVKLKNSRLRQITFHTFRHWKATMEYYRTRDPIYVMETLGHRDIKTTLLYIQLVKNFEASQYRVAHARTLEEEDEYIKAGFEFVRYDSKASVAIYRIPK